MVPYATSKAAVIGLSNSLRPEAAHYGIRINCACPGYIATNIMANTEYSGVDREGLQAAIPLRAMTATRCAELILKGAERNRGLIPVSAATRFEYLLTRYMPWLALRIAAFRATKFREHRST
jgi:NAD(P)-dependent dehydrogenase (short-subunit alcohol dehydrogenase family)